MVLALDIGGTKIDVGYFDVESHELRCRRLPASGWDAGGAATVEAVLKRTGEFMQADGDRRVVAAAAALPGVISGAEVRLAPNAAMLKGVDLRERFSAVFGTDLVTLENDVKAACLAEYTWGALRGTGYGLYINLGTGLSASAVLNGVVYHGANNAALEIGYQLVPEVAEKASCWRGYADGSAPMEDFFSGGALDRLARELVGAGCSSKDLFVAQDAPTRRALQRRLTTFGAQVANLAIAFDVERIVVGGGVSAQYDVIAAVLGSMLNRFVPFAPALSKARFADNAPLLGALELARRSAGIGAWDEVPPIVRPTSGSAAWAGQDRMCR